LHSWIPTITSISWNIGIVNYDEGLLGEQLINNLKESGDLRFIVTDYKMPTTT
jgi:hypothetical protein